MAKDKSANIINWIAGAGALYFIGSAIAGAIKRKREGVEGIGELNNPFTPKKVYGIAIDQVDGRYWVSDVLFGHEIDAHRYLKDNIRNERFNLQFKNPNGSDGWYEVTLKENGKHFADIFIQEFNYYE